MHAFLFTGGTVQSRSDAITAHYTALGVAPYDCTVLVPGDTLSIGVAHVRAFIQHLSLTSQGRQGSAGIIPDAEALTAEAQQALLKTIEEPPGSVRLYIAAASETQLLPTIVSRCQIIRCATRDGLFTPEEIASAATLLDAIVSTSAGHRIAHIQSIGKTREEAKRWIDCAIAASRDTLVARPNTPHITERIHALLDAKRSAANNVNPYQLLEHIFLTTAI